MTVLEHAVVAAARVLDGAKVPYMVIGGLANLVWGVPRATLDVDITVWVGDRDLPAFVERLRPVFRLLPADPLAFAKETRVLPMETPAGMRVELILGQLPFEDRAIRRAAVRSVGGADVLFCTAEDLVAHKIISSRTRDREDVKGILRVQRDRLDRAYLDKLVRELADGLEQPEIWAFYQECWKGTAV